MNGRRAQVVEVEPNGLTWIKSSSSNNTTDSGCLEIATVFEDVLIRCSRDRNGMRLHVERAAMARLISYVDTNS